MAYENKPNSGSLFSNKVKKHPKAPDYQGDILIDLNTLEVKNNQVKVRLAGWKRTTDKGLTFLSLSVDTYKPKEQATQQQPTEEIQDDDIPF
jgi:hypothetical protein